ncbi:MAG: hypothetical protein OXI62_00980 [Chloroflexota bacterium]|nr:hypothetical protein [Chloroflexota bacterium]MYH66375.1 hypothetical protein [Chloroflexota bacterium]
MKRIAILPILASLFLLALLAGADEACEPAEIQTQIQAQLDRLAEDPVSALTEIIHLALAGLQACPDDGYEFSGYAGAQPVLGPVAVSEGLHIITMTTEGSARIDGVALGGCGKDLDGAIHNFSAGQGLYGAANLIEAQDDCVFYLELSKITAYWELSITKVD